ncbi:GGDEF domain-containing protein [Rhizobium daejeonense]|uniref:diguanylate cyclase n=2 Tax=Rhizobium daejeonense TaxID=240521 RepID=A0A6M1SAB5_9HYPH|nr:GGDEF domain-containing protein [Rhizobium daejeonense]
MDMTDNFAFLLPFFMTVFAAIFLSARLWAGSSATFWGLGYLSAAAGFSIPLLPPEVLPFKAQAIVANALFLAAFCLYGDALLARFGERYYRPARYAFAGIALVAIAAIIILKEDLRAELILGDTSIALLLIVPVLQVARAPRRPMDRLLVFMVGLVVVETFTRVAVLILMTSSSDVGTLDAFLGSAYAFYVQFGAGVIAFLLALTVLGTLVDDLIQRYQYAAHRDPLTGLLNRRGFEQAMNAIPTGRSAGTILIGDIDHFKQVNDRLGHAAGDTVIAGFATLFTQFMPRGAILARFGGEEFVAFLPGETPAAVYQAAEKLRLGFASRTWERDGFDIRITASFGIAAQSKSDYSVHAAIASADACLYEAKRAGRNRVVMEGRPTGEAPALRIISSS